MFGKNELRRIGRLIVGELEEEHKNNQTELAKQKKKLVKPNASISRLDCP